LGLGPPKSLQRALLVAGGLNYPPRLNLGRSWGKLGGVGPGVLEKFIARSALTNGDLAGNMQIYQIFLRIVFIVGFGRCKLKVLCLVWFCFGSWLKPGFTEGRLG